MSDRKVTYLLEVKTDPNNSRVFAEVMAQARALERQLKMSLQVGGGSPFPGVPSTAPHTGPAGFPGLRNRIDLTAALDAERRAREELMRQKKADLDLSVQSLTRQEQLQQRVTGATNAHSQAVERLHGQHSHLAKQLHSTYKGIEQLSRAAVLFGVTSQESMEKALLALTKFEAAVQLAKGVTNIGKGIGGFSKITLGAGSGPAAGAFATGSELAAAGGVTAGAISMGEVLAFVAAVAATGAALKVLHENATGTAKELDSWTSKIGDWEAGITGSIAKYAAKSGFSDNTAQYAALALGIPPSFAEMFRGGHSMLRTDRMAHRLEFSQGERERQEAIAGRVEPLRTEQFRLTVQDVGRNNDLWAAEKIIDKQREERKRLLESGTTGAELAEVEKRLNMALQERVNIMERLGQQAERNRDAQIRNGQLIVSNLQDQIRLTAQFLAQRQGQLVGAKERFGQMSVLEQSQTILAVQHARAGKRLGREEVDRLRQLNTPESSGFASKEDQMKADEGGFTKAGLGREIERELAAAQTRMRELNVDVKNQLTVNAKFEVDSSKQIERAKQEVVGLLQEYNENMGEQVTRAIREAIAEVNRTNFGKEVHRSQ